MNARSSLIAVAAFVFAFTPTPASAQPNGWYFGLSGGANWVQPTDEFVSFGGGPFLLGDPIEFDNGWVGLGALGYRWNTWRLELEGGYRTNEGLRDGAIEVKLDEITAMANVLYDMNLSPSWTFSIGAGLGADFAKYEEQFLTFNDDVTLGGQLIAQLSVAVTSRVELFADYHYLVLDDPEFALTGGPPDATSFDVRKHAALIGLRFDLAGDEEPMAAAAPPPPPPLAPVITQFVVFFGFNKCNLTAQADGVVGEAASAAKAQGAARILVVGHTDTVGSSAANQKLSECRANTVKIALVSKGVTEGGISAVGKGKTELLVQTGDGVKEPQNRRATIDLQ
jgi:outer membrane protein OmpA-like peptidoglycan-associated protein